MNEKAPQGGEMTESEVKARLAQAEVHFSHYRWDDAIAMFEAVLAAHADHPAATQGWANAVEQKSIDEELSQALAKVRTSLAAHRFDEALAVLNHAQTRGALSHILKYHSEIDGLRSEAQEGQEWQRRVEAAVREAEALAGRRRFDQALEVLDNTLRPLNARGWEHLGGRLAGLRDRLLAERDVSERVQFAQSAYERQDYRLATELAAGLHEDLPEREDVRRLHERARGAWARIQDQLAAVNEALAQERTDDALALLTALRGEHPHNPDWQAIALRVHLDHGRQEMGKGRSAVVDHGFEDAAEAFERAYRAFLSTVEIFPEHPTAAGEQAEAAAVREAALSASQAIRDRAAFRWEASRLGWQASREQLARAVAVRGRDFSEVVAVVDAMLGEAQAALADLEQARGLLAEGREALKARDAGRSRESFRAGLTRVEGGRLGDSADVNALREQLSSGLRESERIQRDVKKLLSQVDAAKSGTRSAGDRVKLLRRAYEQWETAPGVTARLAEELLTIARTSAEAGEEDAAVAYCEQVRELTSAPAGALSAADSIVAGISSRRECQAALAKATAEMEAARESYLPSPDRYTAAIAVLRQAAPAAATATDLAPEFEALAAQAEDGRTRALAAQPLASESEVLAEVGDWAGASRSLEDAQAALGPLAGRELAERVTQLQRWAAAVEGSLGPAAEALTRAEAIYALASDGDVNAVDWDALEQTLAEARKALRRSAGLPSPLPRAWNDAKSRIDLLSRRGKILKGVREKLATAHGVEAIPVLQADATLDSDPVVLAVLSQLLEQTADDASILARAWLTEAVAALGRGELATTEAYLGLAQSYVPAATQVIPEIRRIERQIAALAQIRSATSEARDYVAKGEAEAALAGLRRALELATDGEAGLPGVARRQLHRLLDLEDDLASSWQHRDEQGAVISHGEDVLQSLLDGDGTHALVAEFAGPVLGRWWKLARRTAGIAYVEAQMALGRDSAALEAAAELVESYPRDAATRRLYGTVAARAHERLLGRGRRHLARARRLAARGDYAEALAEISSEAMVFTHGTSIAVDVERNAIGDALADETAELRAELKVLQALAEPLRSLLEQMREAGVGGRYEDVWAALSRAQLIDPRRRAAAIWEEFDALAELIAERQGRALTPPPAQSRPPVEVHEVLSYELAHEGPIALPSSQADSRSAITIEVSSISEPPLPEIAGVNPSVDSHEAPPYVQEPAPPEAPAERFDAPRPKSDATAEVSTNSVPPEAVAPVEEPVEPLVPFDLDDWLSNVTELGPEDEGTGNGS